MKIAFGKTRCLVGALAGSALFVALANEAAADRRVAGSTRTSVNRSANVNQSTNISRNVNVDIDADRNRHPAATAAVTTAAVATTAAVIGSVTRTLPPACVPVQMGAVVYQQCGGTYYQPQYVGTTVQYVVVSPP